MGLMSLFQAVIIVMLNRLWHTVDRNTDATVKLSIEMPTVYATKFETQRHHDEDQQKFRLLDSAMQEIRDRIGGIDNRITALDGNMKDAQAGMRS